MTKRFVIQLPLDSRHADDEEWRRLAGELFQRSPTPADPDAASATGTTHLGNYVPREGTDPSPAETGDTEMRSFRSQLFDNDPNAA